MDVGLFHLLIGAVGEVSALRVGDGDQLGLALRGVAHQAKIWIRPTIERFGLAFPIDFVPVEAVKTLWSARLGVGAAAVASMRRNADTQAPMPRPSDRIAAAEVTFLLSSWRQPKTASARRESSQGIRRTSRLCSRWRNGRAEGAAGFGGIAAVFHGFGQVRLAILRRSRG